MLSFTIMIICKLRLAIGVATPVQAPIDAPWDPCSWVKGLVVAGHFERRVQPSFRVQRTGWLCPKSATRGDGDFRGKSKRLPQLRKLLRFLWWEDRGRLGIFDNWCDVKFNRGTGVLWFETLWVCESKFGVEVSRGVILSGWSLWSPRGRTQTREMVQCQSECFRCGRNWIRCWWPPWFWQSSLQYRELSTEVVEASGRLREVAMTCERICDAR